MDYIQVIFTLSKSTQSWQVDLFKDAILEFGFDSFVDTDEGFEAYSPKEDFNKEGLFDYINASDLRDCISTEIKQIEDQNWNYLWEQTAPSVRFSNQCVVRRDYQPKIEGVRYDLIINPCQSFGTATHPTTAMMIELLLGMESLTGKSVMDMGCGTAVLAILAHKMGAKYVEAIDIDHWAYENALNNTKLNNALVEVKLGGSEAISRDKFFDIFIANINLNILKDNMKDYAARVVKDGLLFLSGFYTEDKDEILKETAIYGFTLQREVVKDSWIALVLKRE